MGRLHEMRFSDVPSRLDRKQGRARKSQKAKLVPSFGSSVCKQNIVDITSEVAQHEPALDARLYVEFVWQFDHARFNTILVMHCPGFALGVRS
jgi:hypothetical protein